MLPPVSMVCEPGGRREAAACGLGSPQGPLGRLSSSPCVSWATWLRLMPNRWHGGWLNSFIIKFAK